MTPLLLGMALFLVTSVTFFSHDAWYTGCHVSRRYFTLFSGNLRPHIWLPQPYPQRYLPGVTPLILTIHSFSQSQGNPFLFQRPNFVLRVFFKYRRSEGSGPVVFGTIDLPMDQTVESSILPTTSVILPIPQVRLHTSQHGTVEYNL
jgi:hypothetical protein